MQSIIHDQHYIPLLEQINQLYCASSDSYKPLVPHVFDRALADICEVMAENVDWFEMPQLKDFGFKQIATKQDNNTVIVCISGGKDSVALAKLLVDDGYNVYLYHMRGINKVYYDEFEAVERIAKQLNVPYYIDTAVLCGTHKYTEHPMKNMIIANGAITYALENDLPVNIAFGNFMYSYLDDNEFDVCAGDCMDMWYTYITAVRTVLPDFQLEIRLHNNAESLKIIKDNIELLPLSISCISPYRFRKHWSERTSKKYRVQLLPNRCGCCWKCAVEYIYYTDAGHLEYNEPYYLHCIEILGSTLTKESGIKITSIEDIWNEYLDYDIDKSHAKEILKNAIIQNGKIKCITPIIE